MFLDISIHQNSQLEQLGTHPEVRVLQRFSVDLKLQFSAYEHKVDRHPFFSKALPNPEGEEYSMKMFRINPVTF